MTSTFTNDISLFSSKEQYQTAVDELGIKYDDPRNLDEVINARKELYSKLKFQYLEQETKEKFLRLIIDNKPIYIEEQDLRKIENDNAESKSKLKAQKSQNESLLNELLNMSSSIAEQTQQLTTLKDSNDELLSQIAEMNMQLKDITAQTDTQEKEFNLEIDDTLITKINEFNNDPDLSTNLTIANSVTELTQIINARTQESQDLSSAIERKAEEVGTTRSQTEQDMAKSTELEKKRDDLLKNLQAIMKMKESRLAEDEETSEFIKLEETGKELSKLISVWSSMSNHHIEFEEVELDKIVVKIDNAKLTVKYFDDNRLRCFKILKVEGMEVSDSFIDECNYNDDCIGHFIKVKLN